MISQKDSQNYTSENLTNGLKGLLEGGLVKIAKLPKMNSLNLNDINHLEAYTIPLIAHDYAAKTPIMWNSVYEKLDLNLRNIVVVADPKNTKEILQVLKEDPKYLGGGAGVGFKESVAPFLDELIPNDLTSVNIIYKKDGKLIGQNTDAKGLYLSVENALNKFNKPLDERNYLIFGAGGVAKEFARELARNKAKRITIVNRTYSKAVALAESLNREYGKSIAFGIPEDLIRGAVLNTLEKNDALINTTDKGSDGKLIDTSAFAESGRYNHRDALTTLRDLAKWNKNVVVTDIVLPKGGESITLRQARSAGLENLLNGLPMVINQGGPAYKLIEDSNKILHKKTFSLKEVLKIMAESANK